jgi:hypothetical protein
MSLDEIFLRVWAEFFWQAHIMMAMQLGIPLKGRNVLTS